MTKSTINLKVTNKDAKGNYASVNGLNMYYEIHGTGRPLVLLHWSGWTIDTSFGKVLPSLAKTRQVIAVEQQGHGHTADIDRPLSYEQMAEDTAALLRHLKIEGADVFGYSDGGNVALHIAVRHPNLVRKLVVAGTNYNNEGLHPWALEFIKEQYEKAAPNPEQVLTFDAKVLKLWMEFEGWRPEDIRSINTPVMVMVGDDDAVRPEHAVEMFRLLPHSRLAVLPGTNHEALVERPDWLLSMIEAFLDAPMPEVKKPEER